MAKMLFVAGLVSFVAAFIAEIAFILLGLSTTSVTGTASPARFSAPVVWGLVGVGGLCWAIATAVILFHFIKSRG